MKNEFIKTLSQKYFLRLHMTAIITITLLSGLLFSKLAFGLGWTDLTSRYLVGFLFSYMTFLLMIKLWLSYIFQLSPTDDPDIVDDWFLFQTSKNPQMESWQGKGGSFSGGGNSQSWTGDEEPSTSFVGEMAGDVDADIEAVPLIVIVVLLIIALSAVFAGAYLIVEAPMFLGEIAFQLALSLGIFKVKDRKIHPISWLQQALKKTIIPVICLSVLIVILGQTIKYYNPEINNAKEFISWYQQKTVDKP